MSKLSIKVGGIPYRVKWCKTMKHVEHEGQRMESLFGQTHFAKHSIRVAKDTPPERQQETLMHELVHCIVLHYQINEMVDENGVHIERAVDLMATGIMEVLTSLGISLPDNNNEFYGINKEK